MYHSANSRAPACSELITGVPAILRFIARSAAPGTPPLYGTTPLQAGLIDQWLDYTAATFVSGPGLAAAVAAASHAIALHTHVAGGAQLSIADLHAWGVLSTEMMWSKVQKDPAAGNLLRWFLYCQAQAPLAAAVAALNPKKAAAAAKVRCLGRCCRCHGRTAEARTAPASLGATANCWPAPTAVSRSNGVLPFPLVSSR